MSARDSSAGSSTSRAITKACWACSIPAAASTKMSSRALSANARARTAAATSR
ncbi:Uncharacterised protein [Mycobacterium tuberculosis]|uniref:Uncharacterized protein n=1 Tax=Mycobacterium tuberculosis TaxID=1773 RepID=A0A0U0SI72_MYCTX|nr:Uncharacterised protein [Mycobacterium tuberculosis]COW79098.1 Uncharacterised protein [Mycobacterium tuberculosis]